MTSFPDDDETLRRYLLGRLAPESQDGVEARLFSDDRIFWERLSLVEDELINDYARGALSDEEREECDRCFLSTDERRGKLEFARALQNYVERRHTGQESRWQWLRNPVVVPAWAAAAATILLLVVPGSVWIFRPTGPGEDPSSAATPNVLTVSLSPGLTRNVGVELARVRITPANPLVQLQLDLGAEEYATYRATLHEVTGDEMWSQAQLMRSGGDRRVTITLPSGLLADGDYFVRLFGVSAGTDPVSLHRYDFRVLRD